LPAILEATIHCDGTADGFARWLPRFRAGVVGRRELEWKTEEVKVRHNMERQL
jgi:hypothetical protein